MLVRRSKYPLLLFYPNTLTHRHTHTRVYALCTMCSHAKRILNRQRLAAEEDSSTKRKTRQVCCLVMYADGHSFLWNSTDSTYKNISGGQAWENVPYDGESRKLQALVYDILPSTTGLRHPSTTGLRHPSFNH